jgi:16S rRNA (adenine1518-N6/adenine1519-N6)-dimethyltransferase
VVLEIGPGIGTMTQYLAEAARKVIAIEIDAKLIPILQDTLQAYSNVRILNQDVLKVDLNALAEEEQALGRLKVVANLPYYITTPILMGLFEKKVPVESITVMVQKEVAQRMQVGPGTKDYGALSLAVQYYAEPRLLLDVSPNCFMPRPQVGSAVIQLKKRSVPAVSVTNEEHMFSIIRAAFQQRRKTLANGLKNATRLSYAREQVEQALEALGLPPDVRGEALTLEQFAALSNQLLQEITEKERKKNTGDTGTI